MTKTRKIIFWLIGFAIGAFLGSGIILMVNYAHAAERKHIRTTYGYYSYLYNYENREGYRGISSGMYERDTSIYPKYIAGNSIHNYIGDLYSGYVDNEMEYRFETCKDRWLRHHAIQYYIKLTNSE